MHYVCRTLRKSGLYVWVVCAESRSGLTQGDVHGKWCLGSRSGQCVGALLWLIEEEHACALHSGSESLLEMVDDKSGAALPPWLSLHARCGNGVGTGHPAL